MSDASADSPASAPATGQVRQWLAIYLKGVFMGAADTVPGISGGTIALITGIYERLVSAVAAINFDLIRYAPAVRNAEGRRKFRATVRRVDLAFLVVLGLGIVTAVLSVSRVVATGLVIYRGPTNAFFFGLIAASAVVLYREVMLNTPIRIAAALTAGSVAFWISGMAAGGGIPHDLSVVLVTGAVASSAMLLPGISGAALLYVLGQYEFMINTLHEFVGAFPQAVTGHLRPAVEPGIVLATFLIGVAGGLLTIAHGVQWALRRDRGTTLTVLVSLMVGALRLPAEEVLAATNRWHAGTAAGVLAAATVGVGLVLLLDHYTADLKYDV